MATLTKKDLLEAIEDMPMDAEIGVIYVLYGTTKVAITDVKCDKENNEIILC